MIDEDITLPARDMDSSDKKSEHFLSAYKSAVEQGDAESAQATALSFLAHAGQEAIKNPRMLSFKDARDSA